MKLQRDGLFNLKLLYAFYLLLSLRQLPIASGQTCGCPQTNDGLLGCPAGYVLLNGLCYPPNQPLTCTQQCPTVTTPTATSSNADTTTTPTITTTPTPSTITKCPKGSVFMLDKCRKIICPYGEYIAGRCLKAICPENMVWRGHSCQERNFITTIIEIENLIKTETSESHGNFTRTNENHKNLIKPFPATEVQPNHSPSPRQETATEAQIMEEGCCEIYLPRTCKIFRDKWVCHNPKRRVCHQELCKMSKMYVKTPQFVEEPNFVVIPPAPQLAACNENNCGKIARYDCSGCARGLRQTCSPYCYSYNCPSAKCDFVDWHQYCSVYPSGYGCTSAQGCKWNWCG